MNHTVVGAPLRVMELFAGVGGFRLGMQGWGAERPAHADRFEFVWSNQWEPSTRKQHASHVYAERWGSAGHTNEDIFNIVNDPAKFAQVVAARPDVLVGGFPCQDYSVAKPANGAAGLQGKKGVLWWAIHGCLDKLQAAGQPVKYLILENVDRLLKSPTACRGRDFAIILASLAGLGYDVEWRVVNAADYGHAQRRRRVFIVGTHRSCRAGLATPVDASAVAQELFADGVLARALPVEMQEPAALSRVMVGFDPLAAQAAYETAVGMSRFGPAGLMVDGVAWSTQQVKPAAVDCTAHVGQSRPLTLGDIIAQTGEVPADFYLNDASVSAWQYLKGAKRVARTSRGGHSYEYGEGAVAFPDPLDRPSRTLITGEGGAAPSRFKHVVACADGRLRRLVPEELEALNGFPRGFTNVPGISDARRAFFMGNALVVGVVGAVAANLATAHDLVTVPTEPCNAAA